MHTVRTKIPFLSQNTFKRFVDSVGLSELIIGTYDDINPNWYGTKSICYAYSDKSDELVAQLMVIMLKYGSVEAAYNNFINRDNLT
jgi:hypothetical protein